MSSSDMLDDDCDECVPSYMKHSSFGTLFHSLPFILTFVVVAYAVVKHVYPLLSSGGDNGNDRRESDARLPVHNFEAGKSTSPSRGISHKLKRAASDSRNVAKAVFATTIGLSAVLVELILCEISNTLDPNARRLALNLTLPTLLVLVVIVAPGLEMRSIIAATGLSFQSGSSKGRLNVAWILEGTAMTLWLLMFWYFGHGLITLFREDTVLHPQHHGFSEGCLERVGIVGIFLMASLAGFAALSALWHTFAIRDRPVTEADITRKEAGLSATDDMLAAKRSRLRAITRKMSDARAQEGVFTKVVSTFRGTSDSQERSTLQLEISGLQLMRMSLTNSLYSLRNRRSAQLRGHTVHGKLISAFSYGFAIYCAYRLANTSFNIARRMLFGSNTSSTDLVTHLLALLAHYWDASIDQELWSHQISFLLSGIMLLLAFNSALQTFLLLARAFPSLLSAALGGSNFALVVSQVCASYVISSAILLRSNLPSEVRGVISDVLGAPLEVSKVDALFEVCFVMAAGFTLLGIWIGRKLNGPDDEDSAMEGGEMNKMS